MSSSEVSAFFSSMEEKLGGVPCNFDNFKPGPVFVGQDVTELVTMFGKKIQTGSGLFQDRDRVIATQVGLLTFEPPNVYWVEHFDHRYVPRVEDNVIGVVKDSFTESYRVDIASTSGAVLPVLAFDGASKRNRPNLKIGTLVYARVVKVDRDLDPELSCMVASGPRKDWMTGQSVYGELRGGFVFECSLSLAESLLDPECPVLLALAKSIAFEVAVGVNGIVWVNAEKEKEIAVVCNAIRESERVNVSDVPDMVQALIHTAFGSKSKK